MDPNPVFTGPKVLTNNTFTGNSFGGAVDFGQGTVPVGDIIDGGSNSCSYPSGTGYATPLACH
jgi:hypothetical protein